MRLATKDMGLWHADVRWLTHIKYKTNVLFKLQVINGAQHVPSALLMQVLRFWNPIINTPPLYRIGHFIVRVIRWYGNMQNRFKASPHVIERLRITQGISPNSRGRTGANKAQYNHLLYATLE